LVGVDTQKKAVPLAPTGRQTVLTSGDKQPADLLSGHDGMSVEGKAVIP
jgi:hypothetical protein